MKNLKLLLNSYTYNDQEYTLRYELNFSPVAFQKYNHLEELPKFERLFNSPKPSASFNFGMIGWQKFNNPEVLGQGNKYVYTHGLADCVGLGIWTPSKTWIYHVTKQDLGVDNKLSDFFQSASEGIDNKAEAKVFLTSSMYSDDFIKVENLVRKNGFENIKISQIDYAKVITDQRGYSLYETAYTEFDSPIIKKMVETENQTHESTSLVIDIETGNAISFVDFE